MSDTNDLNEGRNQEQDDIRDYLLGDLSDEDKMRGFEEKLLTHDKFSEELSLAEDELVEEYIDDRLSQEERQKFERVLRISTERQQKVRLVSNLQKYASRHHATNASEKRGFDWRNLLRMPTLGFAGAAIVIVALVIGLVVSRSGSNGSQGIAELRAAYAGKRPYESRLSFESGYSAFSKVRGDSQPQLDPNSILKAKALLLSASVNSPSDPAVSHALGALYLAEKRYTEALSELEKALAAEPRNARLLNDLALVCLERTDLTEAEQLKSQAQAINYLNRALQADPTLNEAIFNRAVAFQRLHLDTQAREAWQEYLERDPSSEWAEEARRNLKLLETGPQSNSVDKSNVLRDFRAAYEQKDDDRALAIARETKELISGMFVQALLVKEVVSAVPTVPNQSRADALSTLAYLGRIERERNSDFFFAEHADYLRTATDAQLAKLSEADRIVEAGYQQILRPNWKDAVSSFEQAKASYVEVGNTWEADLAEYQICYVLTQFNRIEESNARLADLLSRAERKNHKWLLAITLALIGSNNSLLGLHSKAIEFDKKARDTADAIGDIHTSQKAEGQLTYEYYTLGDEASTLASIAKYVDVDGSYFQSPRQRSRNLLFATQGFYSFAMYDAAEVFAKEQLHLASTVLNDKWLTHTAQINLAIILSAADRHDLALDAIKKCFEIVDSFPDEAMRERQRVRTTLILARLQRNAGQCPDAIENYRNVISGYEQSEFQVSMYEARKGKLLCSVAQLDDAAVKADIPGVIELFDRNRQTIEKEEERNVFFDREQTVYDIAADYTYKRLEDARQAFDYVENAKARSLLRSMSDAEAVPLTSTMIQQQLPVNVDVLYYAMLRDRLLIWRLSAEAFDVVEVPITADQLQRMARQFNEAIISKRDTANISHELYKTLIDPIIGMLKPGRTLCIVGDKILFALPFAALRSPAEDEFLLRKFPLVFSPSATVFVTGTAAARSKALTYERFLGVGNPSFSRQDNPGLADLPDALVEVRESSRHYGPAARLLVSARATRSAFLTELANADVVHFAGHYVTDSNSPANSRLLTSDSDLTIAELSSLGSVRPRLVILSACESGVEGYLGGEGFLGASRAFLGAGVPVVVGTQWSVDSAAMTELMTSFHRHRKQSGATTADSIRRAQLEMLASENTAFHEPYFWAGVMTIGGYSDY